MSFRIENLISNLLKNAEFTAVDTILDFLDIESTGNYFDDLIEIAIICKSHSPKLESFGWFKKRLINKIFEERGEGATQIISKIMK